MTAPSACKQPSTGSAQKPAQAIDDGLRIRCSSERNREVTKDQIALSALVACGAVHHHLVSAHQRTQIGLIIETGEAREVHHFCLCSPAMAQTP